MHTQRSGFGDRMHFSGWCKRGEAADQKGQRREKEMQKDEQGEEGAVDVAAAERFAAAIPAGWIGAGGSRETTNQSGA